MSVEGSNFKQLNSRMADVSNLKINERANVERPNLWVTKKGHKNWENWFISKGKYETWWNFEYYGISDR